MPSSVGVALRIPAAALLVVALAVAGCGPEAPGPGGFGDGGAEASFSEGSGPPTGREEAGLGHPPSPIHPLDERPNVHAPGMDSLLLAAAVERAAALPRLHNMIVARHGEVVVERHFRGPGPAVPANVKSVSKSLLSALVGIAVAEGHLEGPDQKIMSFFPEYTASEEEADGGATGAGKDAITLAQLLSMTSGLQSTSGRNYGRWVTSPDWVRHVVDRPLVASPGERMIYSTGSTHLVSAILSRAVGRSTHAFAQDHLAAPLGIRLPPWPTDPQGIHFGGNDMLISPRDLLTFGEMYRGGGRHEGQQVLPRDWVVDSWDVHTRSPRNGNVYGLGWWGRTSNGTSIRFAWGYGGQFLFVVPALELTVVFTSDPVNPREGPHNRALHDLVDEFLVPAAMRGGGSAVPRSPAH